MGEHGKYRALVSPGTIVGAFVAAVALGLVSSESHAQSGEPCSVALALGLDVSASVDAQEYRLQLDGLAAALSSPPVRDILFSGLGGSVNVAVYEWSGWEDLRLIVDWTRLSAPSDLDQVVGRLASTTRVEMSDSTALGMALLRGGKLLQNGPDCWRKVLDISGDGKNNDGADPDMLDDEPSLRGVTVNALVIGADDRPSGDRRAVAIGELSSYFNAFVIRGPGAFVQVALGFEDYERAMTQKLLRELQPTSMSALDRINVRSR